MTSRARPPRFPALEDVYRASERIRSVARRTPLVPLHELHGEDGLFLKLETSQPIGSFKLRGVFNAVASLPDEERRKGLSTVSAGNTAQALAFSGRHFGVESRSVMPDSAPGAKIEAMRAYGGVPVLVPVSDVFRFLKERLWEREPYAFIHPWTNLDVMTGHGTLGIEIVEQLPDVDTVFVPVGGGGLICGVGAALRALKPEILLIGVEPECCPSLHESLRAGRPVEVECRTLCDGVAVPYITDEMFPLLEELVSSTRLVSEDDVKKTMRSLVVYDKLVAEGSGALALAAALSMPITERGRSVAIVTGGSIDARKLAEVLLGQ